MHNFQNKFEVIEADLKFLAEGMLQECLIIPSEEYLKVIDFIFIVKSHVIKIIKLNNK